MKSRSPSDKGIASKLRLIEAALAVCAQQGLEGLSLSQIGECANLKKTLVFHYFKNKEALLEAMWEHIQEQGRAFTVEYLADASRLMDPVETYVRSQFQWMKAHPTHARYFIASIYRASYDHPTHQRLIASMDRATTRVTQLLAESRQLAPPEARVRAREIYSVVIGSSLLAHLHRSELKHWEQSAVTAARRLADASHSK